VLPFAVHGEGGDRSETVADVMTDDLTNILSRVSGFRVISRQTAQAYRGQSVDVAAVGAELRIRYLLNGSVRARDNELSVNVELLDARPIACLVRSLDAGADRSAIENEVVNSLGRELRSRTQAEGARQSNDPDVPSYLPGLCGDGCVLDFGQPGCEAEYLTLALQRDPRIRGRRPASPDITPRWLLRLFVPDPARLWRRPRQCCGSARSISGDERGARVHGVGPYHPRRRERGGPIL
jgi:hypothetical protein